MPQILSSGSENNLPVTTSGFPLTRIARYITSLSSVIRFDLIACEYRCDRNVPRVSVMSINSSQSDLRKSFSTNTVGRRVRSPSAITRIIAGRSHGVSSIAAAVVVKSSYSPATESARNLLIKRLTSRGGRKDGREGRVDALRRQHYSVSSLADTR